MLLKEEGHEETNKKFSLVPPFEKKNVYPRSLQNFIANIFFLFEGVMQYTYDGTLRAAMNRANSFYSKMHDTSGQFDEIIRQ
ncbi:hypothetical protein AB6A40_008772 [Gnathostoma spinigerum]|uniref:Uncharacterized protein n=1 Tax=Gnathostoma spinigerum TaxID=75299 RepID=A0ABD6EYB2_9BILA